MKEESYPQSFSRRDNLISIHSLKAIDHIVTRHPNIIRTLIQNSNKDWQRVDCKKILDLAEQKNIPIKVASLDGPIHIQCLLERPKIYSLNEWLKDRFMVLSHNNSPPWIFALDHILDPHNFGAIMRNALAFNIPAIIFPKERQAPPLSPGVFDASTGAVVSMDLIHVPNIGEALRRLRKLQYWLFGTSLSESSQPIEFLDGFRHGVVVFGSEHKGLSPLIQNLIDQKVKIPQSNSIQSLNVASSSAIVGYQIYLNQLKN